MGVKVDFKVNVPHGEMDITENGQYDVSDYAIANVNVAFETEEKSVTITENGTQEVLQSVGKDALSKVVINTEIPIKEEQSKNIEIKENGTISVLPDEGKVLNEVSITTNVPQDNTLKNLLDATKSTKYLFYEYQGTSVDGLIQYSDTENVEDMSHTFYGSKVVKVPELNTSKVKNFSYAFSRSSISEFPNWDFSNAESIGYLLDQCKSLKTNIVINNLSKLTGDYCLSGVYQQSAVTSVTLNDLNPDIAYAIDNAFFDCDWLTNVSLNTTTGVPMKVKSMSETFNYCSQLKTLPLMDLTQYTRFSITGCSNLESIPAYDLSNITSISLNSLYSLKEFHATGMKVSFNISSSTKFTKEALVEILNNLATVTSTQTLTMGATNLGKLTDEDKLIATNKGWTLA
jgi:hypothetical protein